MTYDPMNGPFLTGRQLTDYSDMSGFAIPPAIPARDPCPGCGLIQWGRDGDPQTCAACGTRVCPLCDADFAEDHLAGVRVSDNLGDHIRQWHPRTP